MVQLTDTAVSKVREILDQQEPKPAGLRIAVVGGGCSGFSYSMAFENQPNMLDKTYDYDGLKVFIDQASLLYLDGAKVDYVETLEGSGFKFDNPQVKSDLRLRQFVQRVVAVDAGHGIGFCWRSPGDGDRSNRLCDQESF